MMQFDVAQHDDVVVISISGDVMGGPDGSTLHDKLHDLRSGGSKNVVVDLDGVRFMNSSGIGMLIGALTTMRNAEGDLRLSRVGERVLSLLIITKLVSVFKHFETVEEAVASFE